MNSVCNIFMKWVLMLTMDLWAVIEVIIIYHPYMSLDSSKCNINTKAMRALYLIIITFFGEKLSSHELYDDVLPPHSTEMRFSSFLSGGFTTKPGSNKSTGNWKNAPLCTVELLNLIPFIFRNLVLSLDSTINSTPGQGVAGVSNK